MILSNRQALVVILAATGLQNANAFVPPSLHRCSPRTTSCAATAVEDRVETPEAEAAAAAEETKLIMDIPPKPAADEIEEMKLVMDIPTEPAAAKEMPEKRNPLRNFYSVSVRKEAAAAVEEAEPASAKETPKKKNPLPNFFSCSVPKEAAAAVVETKPIMDIPPKPAAAAEKPKPEVAEKPKPVAVAKNPRPAAVAEKPKPVVVAEKPKPVVAEKPKPVEAEKPKPAAAEKPKAAAAEKPKPVAAEKPKPAAVAEKPKPAAVAEKRKRSVSPWPTPALTEKAKLAAAEKPKTVAAAKAKPVAAAEKPKPAAAAEKPKRSVSPWPTPAVVNIKKAPPKKAGGHKEGVFSPIVYGAAGVMGEGQLKVVRARVISVHSDLIKSFIGTSDSAFGEATLKQLFNLADADDSGYLDKEELAVALNMLGFKWLDGKQVDKIFAKADANGDERISLEEFMEEAPKVLKMNLIKLAKANGTEMGLMV